jgi:hypothetical protein
VEGQALHLLERYLTLEDVLGLASVVWDRPREAPYPVKDVADAENAARPIRVHWGLGVDPIPNPPAGSGGGGGGGAAGGGAGGAGGTNGTGGGGAGGAGGQNGIGAGAASITNTSPPRRRRWRLVEPVPTPSQRAAEPRLRRYCHVQVRLAKHQHSVPALATHGPNHTSTYGFCHGDRGEIGRSRMPNGNQIDAYSTMRLPSRMGFSESTGTCISFKARRKAAQVGGGCLIQNDAFNRVADVSAVEHIGDIGNGNHHEATGIG